MMCVARVARRVEAGEDGFVRSLAPKGFIINSDRRRGPFMLPSTQSSSPAQFEDLIRVQRGDVDSYQATPTGLDVKSAVIGGIRHTYPQIPVIRVFGSTGDGIKALLHVHGVFPYLYVEYNGEIDDESVSGYVSSLCSSINSAMCVAYRRDPKDSRSIFVASIVLCKGIPFYGFHLGYRPFLKISMLNPAHMSKFADLLRAGEIMDTFIQPYESHIPYIQQFFADYNLYGCGWIKLSDAYFREPIAENFWRSDELKILKPRNGFNRVSYCALEVDATANLIMNRAELKKGSSNFILTSLQELWKKESERRHFEGTSSARFTPKVSTMEFTENTKWSNYQTLKHNLDDLIRKSKPTNTTLATISKKQFDLPDSIPTAFATNDTVSISRRLATSQRVAPIPTTEIEDEEGSDQSEEEEKEFDFDMPSPTLSLKRPASEPLSSLSKKTLSIEGNTYSYFSQSFESSFNLSQEKLLNSFVERHLKGNKPPEFLQDIIDSFRIRPNTLALKSEPPSKSTVTSTIEAYGLPEVDYTEPYYSHKKDVPTVPMSFAGVEFRLKGSDPEYLDPFEFGPNLPPFENFITPLSPSSNTMLELLDPPPTTAEVKNWVNEKTKNKVKFSHSQIVPPTQINTSDNFTDESVHYRLHKSDPKNMMVFSVEIHASGRNGLLPDPEHDQIDAIFWKVLTDEQVEENCGVIISGDGTKQQQISRISHMECIYKATELEMIHKLIEIIRHFDPDILTGYEVQKASWGYMIDRCKMVHEYNLTEALSRVRPTGSANTKGTKWGLQKTTDIVVIGRHVLNLWRILRNELNLLQYSLENVMFNVFNRRIPRYSNEDLSTWFKEHSAANLGTFLRYYEDRTDFNLRLIVSQELVSRYSEQARLIGIDYYSVFYRGSQFKVESLLARLAKRSDYIMISPSKKQVGQQNALEYIPLVMEPETRFYTSPVLVLDFQSLYPSIVIAYNYCYSTCLGRITPWRGRNKLGVIDLDLDPELLGVLEENIVIAPNGIIYVKPQVRKSTISQMLTELLDTRMMVKDGMGDHKHNVAFQKSMNSRQLALKLTANVTYGYTSASYSGRMPCAEIADSIVLSGREILEDAIDVIQGTEKWGAQVVYGDTDSIFVHLPGKSREQAFDIGEDIANVISDRNKDPVKLKFEKVYHPCVLLAKKRYVGYMYEKRTQKRPEFDAKGTETVRRDGTPAEQKIEEKALRILFETTNLSLVKKYLQEQWTKIISGSVSIQDFLFNKEVKLGGYKKGSEPAGALVSLKNMEKDKRSEPQYKERVPYVVISGPPGSRLIDRSVDPEYLLSHPWAQLDAEYYITKNLIPPLERIFNLMGADVKTWYMQMPKVAKFQPVESNGSTLRSYMKSSSCVICGVNTAITGSCCGKCIDNAAMSIFILQSHIKKRQKNMIELEQICRNCSFIPPGTEVRCISGDCPIYYSRIKAQNQLKGYLSVQSEALDALNW